jgi:hypothetical protein
MNISLCGVITTVTSVVLLTAAVIEEHPVEKYEQKFEMNGR